MDSGELGLGSGVSSASASLTLPTRLLGSGLARSHVIVDEGMPAVLPSCDKLQPISKPVLSPWNSVHLYMLGYGRKAGMDSLGIISPSDPEQKHTGIPGTPTSGQHGSKLLWQSYETTWVQTIQGPHLLSLGK